MIKFKRYIIDEDFEGGERYYSSYEVDEKIAELQAKLEKAKTWLNELYESSTEPQIERLYFKALEELEK